MPRVPRNSFDTSFFHVIIQGINREYIFDKNEYIEKYLLLLNKYKREYNISILAYCIMNNHAHLLLHVQKIEEMTKYMHRINAIYANYYNKNETRVGVVFRNRYESEPIFNERYLIQCIKYIHMNPVKAKMVKKCEEYKYSSWRDYANNEGVARERILTDVLGKDFLEWMNDTTDDMIFKDIDVSKEEIIDVGIKEFEKNVKNNLQNIMDNKKEIKDLIIFLKNNYKVTYKEISNKIGITRNEMDNLKRKRK